MERAAALGMQGPLPKIPNVGHISQENEVQNHGQIAWQPFPQQAACTASIVSESTAGFQSNNTVLNLNPTLAMSPDFDFGNLLSLGSASTPDGFGLSGTTSSSDAALSSFIESNPGIALSELTRADL